MYVCADIINWIKTHKLRIRSVGPLYHCHQRICFDCNCNLWVRILYASSSLRGNWISSCQYANWVVISSGRSQTANNTRIAVTKTQCRLLLMRRVGSWDGHFHATLRRPKLIWIWIPNVDEWNHKSYARNDLWPQLLMFQNR